MTADRLFEIIMGVSSGAVIVIGVAVLVLLALWLAWQATIHLLNLLQIWAKLLVWYRYRKRCTCDESDPVKKGLAAYTVTWWRRLTGRGTGIF